MSDVERELEIGRRLSAVGPPRDVPVELHARARAAALDDAPRKVVPLAGRRRVRPVFGALGALAAVAAAAIAILAVDLTRGGQPAVAFTVPLEGANGAWGKVELSKPDGPVREVRLQVDGLPPAPQGRYYALWFSSAKAKVSSLAFNTSADGTATVETSTPLSMRWNRCWVTEEWSTKAKPERTVLVSPRY
jgi:hypothetical protein